MLGKCESLEREKSTVGGLLACGGGGFGGGEDLVDG